MTEAQTSDRNPGTDGSVVALGTSQPLRPHTGDGNCKATKDEGNMNGKGSKHGYTPDVVRHAALCEAAFVRHRFTGAGACQLLSVGGAVQQSTSSLLQSRFLPPLSRLIGMKIEREGTKRHQTCMARQNRRGGTHPILRANKKDETKSKEGCGWERDNLRVAARHGQYTASG